MLQDLPLQMRQSKMLPAETLFADLCLARQNADAAGSSLGSLSTFQCPHTSPCLAPSGGHAAGFWLSAAIDEACGLIKAASSTPRLLELSRTDCGALEYVMSSFSEKLEPGQLNAIDSQPARLLQQSGAPAHLWSPWKAARAAPFSTGNSGWQIQMPEQPLVDLVLGVTSHQEPKATAGIPAANEHSMPYRCELLWRCLTSLTSLATGMACCLCCALCIVCPPPETFTAHWRLSASLCLLACIVMAPCRPNTIKLRHCR